MLVSQTPSRVYGLQLSGNGVQPTEETVRAIVDAPRSSSAAELRSFLGMVEFSARFLPDLSTTAEPLRQITHKNTSLSRTDEKYRDFATLKEQLANAAAHTQVIADASPVGLAAVLVQQQPDVSARAICYDSRTLTSVERRYNQTEKEALGLVGLVNVFTNTSAVSPSTLLPITSLCKLYILPHQSHQLASNAGSFDSRRTTSMLSTSLDQQTSLTPDTSTDCQQRKRREHMRY